MLSFPSILIALLIAGVGHALFPGAHDTLAFGVLIIAIALPGWVQYARAVRGSTMVERHKEYVQAARVIGVPPLRIMMTHVAAQRAWGRCSCSSTIQVATAILAEATLSLSRRRRLADLALARHLHQRGQQAAFQRRLVACHLSGRDARSDRTEHQPVR